VIVSKPTIMALLAEGVDGLFPQADRSPDGALPCPFMVMKVGGEAGNINKFSSFALYAYDTSRRKYWRLEEIMHELKKQLEGHPMPPMRPGYGRWEKLRWEFKSTHLTDGGWEKNMMFCRLSLMGL
jgi:hypothetical protein